MDKEERRPYRFTIDYLRDDKDRSPYRALLNRGLFWNNLPRLILLCRLAGHRPVVDGTNPTYKGGVPSRWVVCDRCGVRAEPQGNLNPARWNIGDAYPAGPTGSPASSYFTDILFDSPKLPFYEPGPIPARPLGNVGAQVIVGGLRGTATFGAEIKIGNCGSEHTLAGNLRLGRLGAVFVHTERFGQGLQRWLNPDGYESRLIGVQVGSWCGLEWRLWSRRDNNSGVREPWWMHGSIHPRPIDRLLGPKRYAYLDVPGAVVSRVVKMPEADYLVELQLRREVHGRAKGRKTYGWCADWKVLGPDIPYRDDNPYKGNGIYSATVKVSHASVRAGTWPAVAVTAIATYITGMRTRYSYDPVGRMPVAATPMPVPA